MNQYQSVIQLAKQSALRKFSALIQHMAQHADQELEQALSARSSSIDYPAFNSARHFLRKSGAEMLEKIESHYQKKLEQALLAMHSNERIDVTQMAATNLTLVDDQTINRQIEVGRLVISLSKSCAESLAQVNVIISQIFEKPEVKEKDNPFRPELIAHALYDVLCAMVELENVRELLLSRITNSLAKYLPEYYTELCDVFKAGGISPKLAARPTSKNPYMGPQQSRQTVEDNRGNANDASGSGGTGGRVGGGGNVGGMSPGRAIPPELLPALERLLGIMQPQANAGAQTLPMSAPINSQTGSGQISPLLGFQQLLNTIFSTPNADGSHPMPGNPASAALLARLQEFQKMAAGGTGVDGRAAPMGNQLFALGDKLGGDIATPSERKVLELIAVLFEMILRDDQIPEELRGQIGQLQIPFLKSAIQDPGTLQQVDHPTRQLLNHMGMVSVGVPGGTAFGQEMGSEFKRIAKTILSNYHNDTGSFVSGLNELKRFMDEEIRRVDEVSKRSIAAMEEVQNNLYLTYGISTNIREVLLPLNLDQRVVDFCLQTWIHVLVKASGKINKAKGENAGATRARLELFFRALPDLVWSAQKKTSTEDRVALIGLLPKLVKVIKSGLKALQIPEDEAKQKLDALLAVHALVLADVEVDPTRSPPTLAALRQMFKVEAIQEAGKVSKATAPLPFDESEIQAALLKRGVPTNVQIVPPGEYAADVEDEWLSEMKVGTRIESKIDGQYQFGRLIWLSEQQSLYMFRLDKSPAIAIYCPASLSRALRNSSITFVETAPTFERAVQTMLQEAELLKSIGGSLSNEH